MSRLRLILASLAYHWRIHVAVGCGVGVGTAVITGALLVGDSMRGSLRQLTLERLGRVDQALVADRFFRARLADELAAQSQFPAGAAAVPAVLLRVSVECADGGDRAPRANRVDLIGCDERFWDLDPVGNALCGVPRIAEDAATASSGTPQRAFPTDAAFPPGAREIVLNEPLAEQLAVKVGDAVLVRLPHPGSIPADTPLGRKSETVRSQRVTVGEIIPARGFGRFSLSAAQQAPRNAYVSLELLQEWLDRPGQANAILVADAAESVQPLMKPTLEDYGIHVARTPRGYVNVTSDRMLLEPAVERALEKVEKVPGTFSSALTYLANTIACGKREIPYSTITAVDFVDRPPLGPMLSVDGKPVAPLADGEIALNRWAADDLKAKAGDTIRVTYFEPESTRGAVREQTATFRLAAVIELTGVAADPNFTPEVPGVTDQLSINNWNPPFPFDARRVRKKDDAYWQAHRATPKAFVSLAVGRKLWSSRFGQATSIRVPAGDPAAVERVRSAVQVDPAAMGFVLRPVKEQGLAASAGTTPFELLFLSFSFFLIVSAAMLVALLFRLGVDRRTSEIGVLLAVGWRRRQVTGLLAGEGFVVAALGSFVGVAAGIGYAAMLIAGLHTLWLAAVATPFMELFVTWRSLAVGFVGGLVVAMGSIAWSARSRKRCQEPFSEKRHSMWTAITRKRSLAPFPVAVALAVAGSLGTQEFQAAAFFGAAALVLAGSLMWVWARLRTGATGPAVALGRGNLARLALRNAARNPARSALTVGLVAAASFLIVAVSAFRIDPAQQRPHRTSANGGFTIVAESDQPIYHDLNTADGRDELGFSPEDSRAMSGVTTVPLRVRPGDDASCLNLYRPQQPRILGVPRDFIDRGGFAWASVESWARLEPAKGALPIENPWDLLEADLPPDQDGVPRVPVVLEKTTAEYSLHLGGVGSTYEVRDGSGRQIRLVVVGLLRASLFQGDLLMSEKAFLRHFPEQAGYRFFLIESQSDQAAEVQRVERILERTLGDFGLWTQTASRRLAAFQAVENTYLSTFQSLGGLGLLLGTLGLGAVQLRSVLERRRELALLRATGFRRRWLAGMVTLENAALLASGLACGVLCAVVAVLPHWWTGAAKIPWASLTGTLGLVLAAGLLAGGAAVRSALRTPLLEALRGD